MGEDIYAQRLPPRLRRKRRNNQVSGELPGTSTDKPPVKEGMESE